MLCFDPRSVFTLSTRLKVLNISGNKITSLNGIKELRKLQVLDATNNSIDDIDDLTDSISALISLTDLSLEGNPVTQYYRYKENLIANNDTIDTLDGKMITDVCRCFMKRFKMKKHLYHMRKSSSTLDQDITRSLNLPAALQESISRAMFQPPGPKLPVAISTAICETQSRVFPPWKIAPAGNTIKNGHFTPRPFWSNVIKARRSYSDTRSMLNNKVIQLPAI